MKHEKVLSGFRELTTEEINAVSGGIDNVYMNGTTEVTEHYDDAGYFTGATYMREDGSGAYFDYASQTVTEWNAPSWGTGDIFACLGVSEVIGGAAGVCFNFANDHLYAYGGGAAGDTPVDLTLGTSADANSYLQGLSVSGNGMPGAGVSLNQDGSVASTAWTVGTPGVQATYGVDVTNVLSDAITQFENTVSNDFGTFSDGMYQMVGRPYDPPSSTERTYQAPAAY